MNSLQQNPTQRKYITMYQWYAAIDEMHVRLMMYSLLPENDARFTEMDCQINHALYNEYNRARPVTEQVFNLHSLCVQWQLELPQSSMEIEL